MVRSVLGLQQPDSGSVTTSSDLTIGYMPQKLQVDATLPVTVERFLRLTNRSKSLIAADDILSVLSETRISHLAESQLGQLSGGELQRVLLARALLRRPKLLILDEPAQGVDVAGQAELYRLIGDIRDKHGCGVLMISHDLHLVMSATDEVVCLNHHVCCHGKPEQVSSDPSYLNLFGQSAAENLAIYTHHHNHEHDIDGNIVHLDH